MTEEGRLDGSPDGRYEGGSKDDRKGEGFY